MDMDPLSIRTPSVDQVHQNMDWVHILGPWTPLSWTGSMDPLFLQVEVTSINLTV